MATSAQVLLSDGSAGVLRTDAVDRLAAVGVSQGRAATRMAVEAASGRPPLVDVLGRQHIWPAAWVDDLLAEPWAVTERAVVVKCGPARPAVLDPEDLTRPAWKRRARLIDGQPVADALGRMWVGIDLSKGPDDAEQRQAVTMGWPLTVAQRAALGAPHPTEQRWAPPAGWALVAAAGGWIPAGYAWSIVEVTGVGAGRYAFAVEDLPGVPRDLASGCWVPTRQQELVDLVPVDIPAHGPGHRPDRHEEREKNLTVLDAVTARADVAGELERRGWLNDLYTMSASRRAAVEALLATSAPSPTPRPPAARPARPTPARPAKRPAIKAKAPAAPKAAGGDWRATAAVLDVDQLLLPDGEVVTVDCPNHFGDVARLAERYRLGCGDRARRTPDPGQVWLTAATVARLGLPDQLPEDPAGLVGLDPTVMAGRESWRLGAPGAWQRVWHPKDRAASVMVVIWPWIDPGLVPLAAGDPDPARLLARCERFAELLGVTLRVDPGSTGLDLAQLVAPKGLAWTLGTATKTGRRKTELVELADGQEMPAALPRGLVEVDYYWTAPNDLWGAGEWVHCWDRGGSYLAALSPTWCGVGDPTHVDADSWDGTDTPGYWRIRRPAWADRRRPAPTDGCRLTADDDTLWATTPTLRRLAAEGLPVDVVEGWAWAQKSRTLRPLYDELRAARSALVDSPDPDDAAVLTAVKGCYTRMVGRLARTAGEPGERGWRPDWRHHVIAQSRVGIDLTIAELVDAGGQLLAAVTDAVWIRSDTPDPMGAWPGSPDKLGRGLGRYQHQGAARWETFALIMDRPKFSNRDALALLNEQA